MVNGFFAGGLAEADRDAQERKLKARQVAVQEGGLDVNRGQLDLAGQKQRFDIAATQAQQSEADAKMLIDGLTKARTAGDPQAYGRLKEIVLPQLQLSTAIALAGRRPGLSPQMAMTDAQQRVQAIVASIDALPDVVSAGGLQGQAQGAQATAAAPGQALATTIQAPADAAKAQAVTTATTGATIDATNARAAATGAAEATKTRAQIPAEAAKASAVTAAQQSNQIVAVPDPNDPSKRVYARQQVGQPAAPPASLVNITNAAETAESKARGETLAKEEGEVRSRADVAALTLDVVRQVRALDADTGRLAPLKEVVGGWMEALGAPNAKLAKTAANLQAFNQAASTFVLGKQLEQKGVQTDADAKRMQQTFGQITNARQANDFIARAIEAQSTRMMQQQQFYEAWRGEKKTADGAATAWQKFIRSTPLVAGKGEDVIFFNEFVEAARKKYPDISDDEIVGEWRKGASRK